MKQIVLTLCILLSTTSLLYARAGWYICKKENGETIMTYEPKSSYSDCVWHSNTTPTIYSLF